MTDTNKAKLSGEARLKANRRKYWTYFAIGMVGSMAVGLMSGLATSLYEDGTIPLWMPVLATIVVVVGLAWATWQYFKNIDEIDLLDNLWAHTIGMYVAILIFGGWWLFAELDLLPAPSAIAVIAIMLVATGTIYGLRKLNFR